MRILKSLVNHFRTGIRRRRRSESRWSDVSVPWHIDPEKHGRQLGDANPAAQERRDEISPDRQIKPEIAHE